jgi:hypothetical protein
LDDGIKFFNGSLSVSNAQSRRASSEAGQAIDGLLEWR